MNLHQDEVVTSDNISAVREYFEHPGAVAILPFLSEKKLLMEKQWRYPVKQELYEFPAGKIDCGETPIVAAKRELLEETGYMAKSWCEIGDLLPVPAYSDEKIFLFVAKDLVRHSKQNTEPGECIRLVDITVEEFLYKVQNRDINDAKTMALAFWLLRIKDNLIEIKWQTEKGQNE